MKLTTTALLTSFILLAGLSTSDTGAATNEPEPAFTLVTVPNKVILNINRDTQESSLVKFLGKPNVQRKPIGIGEGETEPGTVVFPTKPEREISIIWSDRKLNRYPETVSIWGPKNSWQTNKGLRIGTSLLELEKLNGKPFTMSGFDWDYGGRVTSWNGGKLEKVLVQPSKFSVTVGLMYQVGQSVPNDLSGERDISSSDPHMHKVNPIIESLYINYDQSKRKLTPASKNSK